MDWKTLVGFTVIFHGIVYALRREWILRLDTRRLNPYLNGISQHWSKKYFRVWFRIGTYVTIILGFPFTLWLFLRTIFSAIFPAIVSAAVAVTPTSLVGGGENALELHHEQFSPLPDADLPVEHSSSSSSSYLAIQPILPGWNLPLSHLPYYIIAILISVVIHELGHAIASASHRIPILSMGVSLFGPLIPTAHVELNSAQLTESPFRKQLDILTAGVWMNMYLAAICYFVVPKLLPAFIFPTHAMGTGLVVTGVLTSSGAGGPSGLERGDVIIGIENCTVYDLDSWLTCLEDIWKVDPSGFCLQNDTLVKFVNNSEGCCGPEGDNSATHLCFMQFNSGTEKLPANPNASSDPVHLNSLKSNYSSYCLPAKPIVKSADPITNDSTAGINTAKCHAPTYSCVKSSSKEDKNYSNCFVPKIVRQFERFRIVQIHRRQQEEKESVLFVGDVFDLVNGVRTSEYVPRDWFLSRFFGFRTFCMIPVELETVLLLTAGLSAGLAVVNMLPIYGLDGYHVVDACVRSYAGKNWESRKISRLVNIVSWAALVIALLTVVCSIVQSF